MNFNTLPASHYSMTDLATCLNEGFEDYIVPIQFTPPAFLNMLRKDGMDLNSSRVLLTEGEPCGIALIAHRGWTSRLAAMGISKKMRGKGAGSWLLDELIKEACEREDREMVLEVIEQNEPAVKLYEKYGFQRVRRLVGCIRTDAKDDQKSDLQEIDLRELSRLIAGYGLPDLPWQLSAESVAQMNPPARAYRKGPAYIAISNPSLDHVVVWSLLVEQDARGQGLGTGLLKSTIANHPDKTWHMPALCPEELWKVFERANFEREDLSQWQMKLVL